MPLNTMAKWTHKEISLYVFLSKEAIQKNHPHCHPNKNFDQRSCVQLIMSGPIVMEKKEKKFNQRRNSAIQSSMPTVLQE